MNSRNITLDFESQGSYELENLHEFIDFSETLTPLLKNISEIIKFASEYLNYSIRRLLEMLKEMLKFISSSSNTNNFDIIIEINTSNLSLLEQEVVPRGPPLRDKIELLFIKYKPTLIAFIVWFVTHYLEDYFFSTIELVLQFLGIL